MVANIVPEQVNPGRIKKVRFFRLFDFLFLIFYFLQKKDKALTTEIISFLLPDTLYGNYSKTAFQKEIDPS